jgi:hypothetical protein
VYVTGSLCCIACCRHTSYCRITQLQLTISRAPPRRGMQLATTVLLGAAATSFQSHLEGQLLSMSACKSDCGLATAYTSTEGMAAANRAGADQSWAHSRVCRTVLSVMIIMMMCFQLAFANFAKRQLFCSGISPAASSVTTDPGSWTQVPWKCLCVFWAVSGPSLLASSSSSSCYPIKP